ncbi:GAF and ANTAR domain-containing protein [Kribbella sp. NPDC059898]|uniref:GAF and ANTAR domain-containing protein n=1 Tax=Kribbella sp. NPDC059898 TaxID=3346995 RepID=UPI00365B3FBF
MSVDAAAGSAAAFAALSDELHLAPDLGSVLERTLEFASAVVDCDCAAVALRPGSGLKRWRLAGSDTRAMAAERGQQEYGEGPSHSADRSDLIAVHDLSVDPPWTRWGPWISAEFGFHSVLSATVRLRENTLGVLNLYATPRNAFQEPDQALTKALAVHAAVAVVAVATCETRQRAIDAQTEVGQAVGILMERFDVGSDEALALLRRHSQEHNVKLSAVAAELVSARRGPAQSTRPVRRQT